MLQVPQQYGTPKYAVSVEAYSPAKNLYDRHDGPDASVDGDNYTSWAPIWNETYVQWIMYDLGSKKPLSKIYVLDKCDSDGYFSYRCNDYVIYRCGSKDRSSCEEATQCGLQRETCDIYHNNRCWQYSRECEITGGADSRYWMVEFWQNAAGQRTKNPEKVGFGSILYEVWFYGIPEKSPTPAPTPAPTQSLTPCSPHAAAATGNSEILDKLDALMAKTEQIDRNLHNLEFKAVVS